jgi:hypothetical protein
VSYPDGEVERVLWLQRQREHQRQADERRREEEQIRQFSSAVDRAVLGLAEKTNTPSHYLIDLFMACRRCGATMERESRCSRCGAWCR